MSLEEKISFVEKKLKSWGQYVYHTIYVNGKKYQGMRDCLERVRKLFFHPVCSILDLGCNIGGMLWPYRLYSPRMIGVDKNAECVEFCKNLAEIYRIQEQTEFIQHDLEKIEELDHLGEFDIIFLLAMTQHLKNWKKVIKWAHDRSKLLIIEFNGQPKQIEEYKEYAGSLRGGMDYIGNFNDRFLYVCYDPVIFHINFKPYSSYKFNSGTNAEVFYCANEQAAIKIFRNKSYLKEIEWSNQLDCAPKTISLDQRNDILVQEFCGQFVTYFNSPENHKEQIDAIKKELREKRCTGADVEAHIKDDKIKIVDLGACSNGLLQGRLDMDLEYSRFRKIQFYNGELVSVHNNNNI